MEVGRNRGLGGGTRANIGQCATLLPMGTMPCCLRVLLAAGRAAILGVALASAASAQAGRGQLSDLSAPSTQAISPAMPKASPPGPGTVGSGAPAVEQSLGFDAPDDGSAYHRFVADAVAEHQAGNWAEARALFLRAHELEPSARTLRALGMTAFELREYPDAVRELSAALQATRHPLSAAQQRRVSQLLERANTFVGRYHVRLDPPNARLQLSGLDVQLEPDGTLLLPLGRQRLSAQAAGFETKEHMVVVDGSDGQTLRFELEPWWSAWSMLPPPQIEPSFDPTAINPWPTSSAPTTQAWNLSAYGFTWSAASGALGLGGTSLVLHSLAKREDAARRDECMDTCDPWQGVTRTRDRLHQWSGITLGASVALVASAVALYFVEARAVRQPKK
jgi:hypothetical protein